MENEQFTTLVNTLLNNNLASSLSEARRMAEEMMGTSQKVQDSFKKENHTFMVSNYRQQTASNQTEQSEVANRNQQTATSEPVNTQRNTTSSTSMEQSIQELRERALNPQPVQVQVEFQTPKTESLQARQEAIPAPEPQIHVSIPGINAHQTISELYETPTSRAPISEPSRERDDFLTVRQEKQVQPQQVSAPTLSSGFNQSQGLESGFSQSRPAVQPTNPSFQASTPQPSAPAPKVNTPERKEIQLSASEKKLREDCDLSKVFNFSGR